MVGLKAEGCFFLFTIHVSQVVLHVSQVFVEPITYYL